MSKRHLSEPPSQSGATEHRGFSYGVRHLLAAHEQTLVEFLSQHSDKSREQLCELIELGCVYINHQRMQNIEAGLKPGDYIRAHMEPRRYSQVADLGSRVIEDRGDFLIIDKPAGLPVHAMVDNAKENLLFFLEQLLNQKLFITHRLDVGTSGLLLVAKTAEAQSRLNRLLMAKKIRRSYLAWVCAPQPGGSFSDSPLASSSLASGTYIHYMERAPVAPKKVHLNDPDNERLRCQLEIKSVERSSVLELQSFFKTQLFLLNKSLSNGSQQFQELLLMKLEIELATGRTQQIRAQLAALGAPILGDEVYGSPFELRQESTPTPIVALRADHLEFV
jgi:23S rRNA pseudouridine1911/1915/1917 synthase